MIIDHEALIGTLLRWVHVLSGILWLGTLYGILLILAPAMRKLEAAVRSQALPAIMSRALWWLRWSSFSTLILGVGLFIWKYHRAGGRLAVNANMEVDGQVTGRALFIMIGMAVALVLWLLVWFVVCPTWRRILESVRAGQGAPPALMARARRVGFLNAILSGPMLILMFAPEHYRAPFSGQAVGLIFLVGGFFMLGLISLGQRSGSSQ